MQVALIHYRLLRKGGLESRLFNYLDYFHDNGHQVTIFCAKRDPNIKLPKEIEVVKINLGLMPKFFRKWYFDWNLKKVIEKRKFDFSLSLGRTSCQDAVLDPGNHWGYWECLGANPKGPSDYMQGYMDGLSFQKSKIIFAASQLVKDFNIKYYQTPADKIKLLYPPINIRKFNQDLRPQRSILQQQFKISSSKTTFAFVSIGHKVKNLKLLLKIFALLKKEPFELLIAGSKPKQKLPTNVRYLGYVKQPQNLYTAIDYLIHPALFEAFGQVIVESILCGTPVIISKNVGAKEVVSEKEGIIIDSFEAEKWTEVIRGLKNRQFQINPNFGIEKKLTLEDHIEKMMGAMKNITP